MLLERVIALPPRDVIAEAMVRLHGGGWRVVSVGEHHVELRGRRGGPEWPFIAFPVLVLLGHLVFLFTVRAPDGSVDYDRILRYGLLAWPTLLVGLFVYHHLRRQPSAITVIALPTGDGTRLVARSEGSAAASEDLDMFLDHAVTLARERAFGSGLEAGMVEE